MTSAKASVIAAASPVATIRCWRRRSKAALDPGSSPDRPAPLHPRGCARGEHVCPLLSPVCPLCPPCTTTRRAPTRPSLIPARNQSYLAVTGYEDGEISVPCHPWKPVHPERASSGSRASGVPAVTPGPPPWPSRPARSPGNRRSERSDQVIDDPGQRGDALALSFVDGAAARPVTTVIPAPAGGPTSRRRACWWRARRVEVLAGRRGRPAVARGPAGAPRWEIELVVAHGGGPVGVDGLQEPGHEGGQAVLRSGLGRPARPGTARRSPSPDGRSPTMRTCSTATPSTAPISFASSSSDTDSGNVTTSSSTARPPPRSRMSMAVTSPCTAPIRLATWPSAPGRSGSQTRTIEGPGVLDQPVGHHAAT